MTPQQLNVLDSELQPAGRYDLTPCRQGVRGMHLLNLTEPTPLLHQYLLAPLNL